MCQDTFLVGHLKGVGRGFLRKAFREKSYAGVEGLQTGLDK